MHCQKFTKIASKLSYNLLSCTIYLNMLADTDEWKESLEKQNNTTYV